MRTLGLCLIIKNEKDNLMNLFGSVKGVVDSVYMTDTGSTDGSVEEAKKICKEMGIELILSQFDWVNNFSKARNFNFAQAKTDWILWLDGDDTLEGDGLREVIKKAEYAGATGVFLEYQYQTDKQGNVLNRHPKLRAIRNGYYSWTHETAGEVPIHENLFPLPGIETKDMGSKEVFVLHHMEEEGMKDSMQRNIQILRELEAQEGEKADPRTVFLLGRELHSNGTEEQKEEANIYLKKFLKMGGTNGECLHACSMLSKSSEKKGKFKDQLKWAVRGIGYHPQHPLGYLNAGEAYRNMGRWEDAIIVLKQALENRVGDMEMIAFSQYVMERSTTIELANAYNEVGKFDEAIELVEGLRDKVEERDLEQVERSLAQIVGDHNKSKIEKSITVLANSVINNDNIKGLARMVDIVPEQYGHFKPVIGIRRSLGLNKLWNKGNIVIYASVGIEEWDEDSLKTGIGGSETAVIEMAKRLGKAGYHVTIYGDVNEDRIFGNVTYTPAPMINWSDEFDIFISWRNIGIFKEIDIKARKTYLWLHDVVNPMDFTQDLIDKINKIIVLSGYHRGLLPDVPDEKIYVSRNGIDTDLIQKLELFDKRPLKVIYASQPIRGLEQLLDAWEVVKASVTNAELVWAYGWDNYDIMIQRGVGDQEFKDRMVAKMKELGVKDLGRLGKEELYKEFLSSSIFAYPSTFPEINCIVMEEAQACGCYPISTGYAALEETQKIGDKIEIDKFAETLIARLKEHDKVNGKDYYKMFGWNEVANEWMNDLFYGIEWEDEMPLVTVVFITARDGVFKMLKDSLNRQTYKNMELVVVDKLYGKRSDSLDGIDVPHIHLPDPSRDMAKYKYGLCHAHNAALSVATGDLIVFLQDNFDVPEDGIEKFVNVYLHHPNKLISGVDEQFKAEVAKDGEIKWGEKVWTNMWMKIGKGRRMSVYAREWEANWAAAPKKILEKLGGWNIEWDKGHGWDNVDIAFRHIEMDGQMIIDESNKVRGIRHDNDWQGNTAHSNGQRFMSYAQAIQKSKNPKLVMDFREPKYNNSIRKKIFNFKHRT